MSGLPPAIILAALRAENDLATHIGIKFHATILPTDLALGAACNPVGIAIRADTFYCASDTDIPIV
jgi:hypothetical protein